MKRTTLYCTEGTSDKQYTIWIEERDGGLFTVEAQWGRRGGPVQAGAKTPKPVPLAEAEKVYDRVMKEKLGKGYHEGEDAPAFGQVEGAEDTGLRPMLLTDCTEEGVGRFVEDPAWGAQPKVNGQRIMLRVRDGKVVGANRRGLACPIPEAVADEVRGLDCVLDGELVGDRYFAFDLLEGRNVAGDGQVDLMSMGMAVRHGRMADLLGGLGDAHVVVVPYERTRKGKLALVERLRKGRKEGVVFKRLDAPYEPGCRQNPGKAIAVKVKFYAEVAAVVLGWTDKSSVEVGLRDGKGVVGVGKVTVPAKYKGQVKEGVAVRVRYLYATPAKRLYQAHLDPTDDGSVVAEEADSLAALKFEGKEE